MFYKIYLKIDLQICHCSFRTININSIYTTEFQENGFYVECGAYDGETQSTTLLFERYRKWQGLLIEPDPTSFQKLMLKHRMAFILNACLSPYPYPLMVRNKFQWIWHLFMWLETRYTVYSVLILMFRTQLQLLGPFLRNLEKHIECMKSNRMLNFFNTKLSPFRSI